MTKIFALFIIFLYAVEGNAAVRPITGEGMTQSSSEQSDLDRFIERLDIDPAELCRNEGFMKQCPENYRGVYACPYDNRYFMDCCPQEYHYSRDFCLEHNMTPSQDTCYGLYACQPNFSE